VTKPVASQALSSLVLALTLLVVGSSLWGFWRFQQGQLLSDFGAFYCAGRLAGQGLDPYRQEPMYSCESEPASPLLARATGHVTDPAPLPPYALALFVPLSRLPLEQAALLWTTLLAAAWTAIAFVLRALTGYRWGALLAAIAFAAMMSLSLGQIAPLAIALICIAALLLERGRAPWAGIACAAATVEPHVALPVCAAIFIAAPRSRFSIIGGGLVLLALTMLFGFDRNVEYLRGALPAHALSDVADVGQYSLTVLVHAMGFPDALAERAGSIWYAIAAIAGIATACALKRRGYSAAAIALVPMAFAVFGGPYVHWNQVVGAIPAALLMLRAQPRAAALQVAAIVGLAIPWLYVVGWGFLIPGAAAIAGILAWQLLEPPLCNEAVVVAATFCALLFVNHALAHTGPAPPFVANVPRDAWADLSWGAYVRSRIPIGTGIYLWLHLPTWAALAATIGVAVRAATRRSAPTP
jgi:hypothetical protein